MAKQRLGTRAALTEKYNSLKPKFEKENQLSGDNPLYGLYAISMRSWESWKTRTDKAANLIASVYKYLSAEQLTGINDYFNNMVNQAANRDIKDKTEVISRIRNIQECIEARRDYCRGLEEQVAVLIQPRNETQAPEPERPNIKIEDYRPRETRMQRAGFATFPGEGLGKRISSIFNSPTGEKNKSLKYIIGGVVAAGVLAAVAYTSYYFGHRETEETVGMKSTPTKSLIYEDKCGRKAPGMIVEESATLKKVSNSNEDYVIVKKDSKKPSPSDPNLDAARVWARAEADRIVAEEQAKIDAAARTNQISEPNQPSTIIVPEQRIIIPDANSPSFTRAAIVVQNNWLGHQSTLEQVLRNVSSIDPNITWNSVAAYQNNQRMGRHLRDKYLEQADRFGKEVVDKNWKEGDIIRYPAALLTQGGIVIQDTVEHLGSNPLCGAVCGTAAQIQGSADDFLAGGLAVVGGISETVTGNLYSLITKGRFAQHNTLKKGFNDAYNLSKRVYCSDNNFKKGFKFGDDSSRGFWDKWWFGDSDLEWYARMLALQPGEAFSNIDRVESTEFNRYLGNGLIIINKVVPWIIGNNCFKGGGHHHGASGGLDRSGGTLRTAGGVVRN